MLAAGRGQAAEFREISWDDLVPAGWDPMSSLNPVATVDIPLAQSEIKKPFTLDEVEAILKACPSDEWKSLCLLAFYTGARMGDICDLTWENIDLEAADPFISYTQRKLRKAEHSFVKLDRKSVV